MLGGSRLLKPVALPGAMTGPEPIDKEVYGMCYKMSWVVAVVLGFLVVCGCVTTLRTKSKQPLG